MCIYNEALAGPESTSMLHEVIAQMRTTFTPFTILFAPQNTSISSLGILSDRLTEEKKTRF